ncbi:hypothetical protein GWK91_12850 [Virgibacillus sp. MSP4-1]|uniref:hypothetical protein n=1 Tax=Virgibacillus sp. MSP4-1 TaxID=2700081 RepID=UPI0003AAF3E2|nr:hypothetical protein [Virgibacillus sp. MSP4-1]QHS23781.1 hypothetical protein GWK91_12850 [Virgibacillus sp. MSP4-1]
MIKQMFGSMAIIFFIILGAFFIFYEEPEEDTAVEEEKEPEEVKLELNLLERVDNLWGEGTVDGHTALVFRNDHNFPVHIDGMAADYFDTDGYPFDSDSFRFVPEIVQPGEKVYAVNSPIFGDLQFAEDFGESVINVVLSEKKDYMDYVTLASKNITFRKQLYESGNHGSIYISGVLKNNEDENVDGDKISMVGLYYDDSGELIGGFNTLLHQMSTRLHQGEEMTFNYEHLMLDRELVHRIHSIEVKAGCSACN